MRNTIIGFAAVAALALSACSQSAKTASEAKTSMEAMVKEVANDPASVKIENIDASYENDSLTIIHCDMRGKNGFGNEVINKIEYLYLKQGNKKYEAIHTLDADSVYLDKDAWEKARKGTIYEKLDYDGAIRYLAATSINRYGRIVGDKKNEQEVKITVPTQTGEWKLKNYSDSFGDKTKNNYLVLTGNGEFSNSATSNSDLSALLFVDKNTFSLKLLEYGSFIAKDDDAPYQTIIKDSEGNVHKFLLWNSGQSGEIGPILTTMGEDYSNLLKILDKGGEITVLMHYEKYSPQDYRFKLNADGFKNAVKFLK
ncbi:MAG: hypothetical protein J6C81_00500 [Muribaculaceae bacterium]|nr:hypothetical protein [Muribaculaceae bacterium]